MGKLYHIFSMELTKPTLLEVTKTKKQPIEVTNQCRISLEIVRAPSYNQMNLLRKK
jgi:hypothetical protein